MIELKNRKEFENLVLDNIVPVLVVFSASWCGPCRMMMPILAELEKSIVDKKLSDLLNINFSICKINVDELQEVASEYNIQSVPSILLFINGKNIMTKAGFLSYNELILWLNKVLI